MISFLRKLFEPRIGVTPPQSAPHDQQAPPPMISMIPASALGLKRHETRSRPGSYYYKNELPPPLPGIPQIRSRGMFVYRVQSAFHYQNDLEIIVGGRREATVVFRTNCILRSEPENRHDRHAIAIFIGDRIVGHVSREHNQEFAAELRSVGIVGEVQCCGEISGGAIHGNSAANFALSLDLSFPLKLEKPKPKA